MHEGSRVVGHATVLEVSRPEYFRRKGAAFAVEAHQFCDFVERAATFALADRGNNVGRRARAGAANKR
jgi:hypothetical protein